MRLRGTCIRGDAERAFTRPFARGFSADPATVAERLTLVAALLASGKSTVDGATVATGAGGTSVTPTTTLGNYAALQYTGVSAAPTSLTGCGLTWTLLHDIPAGGGDYLAVYESTAGTPAAGDLTWNFGAGTITSAVWSVVAFPNADQVDATVQAVEATGAAVTTLRLTLAALEHSSNVMLAFYGVSGNMTCLPDPNFVELSDMSEATPTTALSAQWAVGETVCDPTFSASNNPAGIAVEVKAASA